MSRQFPINKENKMCAILSFKGNFQINQHFNKIKELDENKFDEIGFEFNKNISLFILDEEKYKLKYDRYFFGLENFLINNKEGNKDNVNINSNEKNKLRLLIEYKTNPELCNSIFYPEKEEEKTQSYFIPILFNNENKHFLFEEIKEEDEPYLRLGHKYQCSINKKYYRAIVEKDNLIVNNYFEPLSSEDKKVIKIKLCLHSLNIE